MVGVRCAGCLQWGKIVLSVSRFVVLIRRDVQGAFWVCLGCCFLKWYLVAAITGGGGSLSHCGPYGVVKVSFTISKVSF